MVVILGDEEWPLWYVDIYRTDDCTEHTGTPPMCTALHYLDFTDFQNYALNSPAVLLSRDGPEKLWTSVATPFLKSLLAFRAHLSTMRGDLVNGMQRVDAGHMVFRPPSGPVPGYVRIYLPLDSSQAGWLDEQKGLRWVGLLDEVTAAYPEGLSLLHLRVEAAQVEISNPDMIRTRSEVYE